ncbi:VanZ family protein [Solibacillus sp. FSL R7-0668]|uniref:VanZ family protein n=1 Tax=Solibacillus sp. FSL R7-0668 TaxID=2921688 RepID=UPI0030FADC70
MDVTSIIRGLFPWIITACCIFGIIGFSFLIYQKKRGHLHKQKIYSFITLLLLICWFTIVLGITTLGRGANYESMTNLNLYSGYINAWNNWSLTEFQLIIFNIIMFVPLGILLPFYNKKFNSFTPALIVSLGVTLLIECIQLVTQKGIFELDDIFHNTLGGIIGFYLIIGIRDFVQQRKLKSLIKAIALPTIFSIILLIPFTFYSIKEFGNMPILPAERQDMEHVTVESKLNFSDEPSSAAIYQNISANDLENGKKIATILSNEYGLTQKGKIYTESRNRIFKFEDESYNIYQLNYVLTAGTWTLTNFASEELEISPAFEKTQKELFEKWMKTSKLLPDDVNYSLQGKELRWDVITPESIKNYNQDFSMGLVMITPSKTKIPSTIFYSINENNFIKNVDIISPKKAYEEIINGNFEIYPALSKGDSLNITGVDISYVYDTKGYYQPVYNFEVHLNNEDYFINIQIPAMMKSLTNC